MKASLFATCLLLSHFTVFAQNRLTDEKAITAQISAMLKSWNNHNYDDIQNYTTADVDWVNVVGMWWKGQKEMQFAHQAYHNTFFKNLPMELKSTSIRFITKDVAVAHIIQHYGAFYPPDGIDNGHNKRGDTDDIATLVFVKQQEKWLITAGENVWVDENAVKYANPVNNMPKH